MSGFLRVKNTQEFYHERRVEENGWRKTME